MDFEIKIIHECRQEVGAIKKTNERVRDLIIFSISSKKGRNIRKENINEIELICQLP
tara:strand:- start:63994 stop:64164 length:171 start_codon:yes stop_codon:yes gene_type:complete